MKGAFGLIICNVYDVCRTKYYDTTHDSPDKTASAEQKLRSDDDRSRCRGDCPPIDVDEQVLCGWVSQRALATRGGYLAEITYRMV